VIDGGKNKLIGNYKKNFPFSIILFEIVKFIVKLVGVPVTVLELVKLFTVNTPAAIAFAKILVIS